MTGISIGNAASRCVAELQANRVAAALIGALALLAGQPAQASADGKTLYQNHCASCHGETLRGTFGPPLKGDAFRAKWQNGSQLRANIAETMPPANAGALPAAEYDAITNYVLKANGLAHLGLAAGSQSPPEPANASTTKLESGGTTAAVTNHDAAYEAAMAQLRARLDTLTPVSKAQLLDPPAGDWLHWRRTYDAQGFSPLDQINRDNAASLTMVWSTILPTGTNAITPLARDGVIFINSNGTVQAIDGSTGNVLWTFERDATVSPMGAPVTQPRGLAMYRQSLIVPTVDSHLIALDIKTGKMLWDHAITGGRKTLRITAPPLVVKDKIIQGMAGCAGTGEPGGCFVIALDARTGKELWRFKTIAQQGEPDGDSWNGAPNEKRFGSSIWAGPSYDPQSDLVYVGTGQTYHIAPLMNGAKRGPENAGLYTDSTLALDPDTGRLAWHFQHMTRDVWDMDWSFERTVASLPVNGKPRRVVMTMGKQAILDVLDARTGKYLFSHDLGLQDLITAIDPETGFKTSDPALEPDPEKPVFMCPFATGFRNWPPAAFDPTTSMFYTGISDSCMEFSWTPGEDFDITYGLRARPDSDGNYGGVSAIDLNTNRPAWSRRVRASATSAVLATGGGVLFEGDRDRNFRALDSATGEPLWSTRLPILASATPITFTANGRQFVAVTAGGGNANDVTTQSLTPEITPSKPGTILFVFAVPEDN